MGQSWLSWPLKSGRSKADRRARTNASGSARRVRLLGEALEERRLLAAINDLAALSQLGLDTSSHRGTSLLVQFREGTVSSNFAPGSVAGARLAGSWAIAPGLNKVELSADANLEAALAAYRSDPNVLFAEPDFRVSLNLSPDDPDLSNLWGLNNVGSGGGLFDADIDAPEAWEETTGSHETIVAVIDTGIDYTHPDLAANIWVNTGEIPGNRIDDDDNGYVDDVHGYDFVNNDGDPMDDHFHGTHVAGTIGAVGNNGIGITGVNWNVQIMALKFLDAGGGGYTSDAIEALNYAVANGAIASNNSWGGGGFSAAFQTAVQNAANKGHIFVAAAGNDGWNNDADPFYPAGYNVDNVVSVGATDFSDQLAYFSNYGVKSVDLTAPGVGIYSTFPTRMTDAMRADGFSTNYESISGTSMATPHVTGVIALVASIHPDWSYSQIIEQVLGTVDVVPGAAKTVTGGRLNAAAAVGNPPPDVTGPRVLGNDPSGGINGTVSQVRLRFNENIDVATLGLEDIQGITGPDGPITALAIVPVTGSSRQFDVTFAPQTTLGAYSLRIGPNISDATGNLMDQDVDGVGGEDPADIFEAKFSIVDILDIPSDDPTLPLYLPGLSLDSSTLTINQDVTISDLNITLDLDFTFDGDLSISLISPRGTVVNLSQWNGGMDSDFDNTVFDDEAPTPISQGDAPFAGSFRPDQPLSALDGQNARGTWTLLVNSMYLWSGSFDGWGFLNAWSLQLEPADGTPPPPPPVGNRAPVANDDAFVGNDVNENVVLTTADLLANDTDPDGNALTVKYFTAPVGGTVTLSPSGQITFTPDPFFAGKAGFDYVVSDGLLTDEGHVSIDIEPTFQWHNLRNPLDVDDSKTVGPYDAILIINLINTHGSTPLESVISGAAPAAYYDVVPNNLVAPSDVIEIINYLNAHPPTPTTSAASAGPAADSLPGLEPVALLGESAAASEENAAAATAADAALHAHCVDLLLAELDASRTSVRRRR